jgi:hypothetical protein
VEQPGWCLATGPALVKRETLPLTSDEKRALSITRRHKRKPVRLLADPRPPTLLAIADEVIE